MKLLRFSENIYVFVSQGSLVKRNQSMVAERLKKDNILDEKGFREKKRCIYYFL